MTELTRLRLRMAGVSEGCLMEVGFIGLGHMGTPIALNLLKAGHRVIVYNRTRSKAKTLGAQIAEQITDTCRGEVLITMLSDDAAVEDIIFRLACLSARNPRGIRFLVTRT